MYKYEPEDLEGRFTRYAAIALATAAIEKLLTTSRAPADVHSLLARMCDELWRWQEEDKVEGKTRMTPEEARGLPSVRFYTAYDDALLALQDEYRDDEQVRSLLYAAQANLAFMVWQMDALEALLNPGKPFVGTCDIAEVGWETLAKGLEHAVAASDRPQELLDWLKEVMARLAGDHPAPERADDNGRPVARSYFFAAPPPRAEPAAPAEDARGAGRSPTGPEQLDLRDPDELEGTVTDHAAIAFATASIEQVLAYVASRAEVEAVLSSLVDDLWSWQSEDRLRGRGQMSEEEARAQPSCRFYARVDELGALAAQHEDDPQVYAALRAAMDALDFIAWIMDGIERRSNPGKPFVLGEAGDREWEALTDALGWARKASDDPDRTAAWQEQALLRVAREHPGDPEREVEGEPVERGYFSRSPES